MAILLLIFYAWFIRFEIRLGAVFGFFFLGFVYYIYYNYKYYNIRDFTLDKNNKDAFLSKILSNNNLDAIEGTVIYGKYSLEFPIGGESVSYMNMNPAGVDFYYNSRDFIQYSYLNYKMFVPFRCLSFIASELGSLYIIECQLFKHSSLKSSKTLYWSPLFLSPNKISLYNFVM